MNAQDSIEVQISANVSGLVAGMKQAAAETGATTQQMQEHFSGISRGAHEAGGALEHVTGHLREMRQEARLSHFIGGQFAEMGIASKEAAAGAAGLFSSFAIGGGIGLAIEGVKLLVEHIHEMGEAAEKEAEAITAAYSGMSKSITEAMRKVEESFEPKSKTQAAWEAQVQSGRKEIEQLQKQIDKINSNAGGVRDLLHELTTSAKGSSDAFTVSSTQDLIAPLQARQQAILKAIDDARPSKKKAQAAEDEAAQEEADEKEAQADEILYAKKIKLLEENYKQEQHYQHQLDVLHIEEADAEIKHRKHAYDATTEDALKALQKIEAEEKKHEQEAMRVAKSIGDAYGIAFAGLVDGTMSVGAAFKDMAKMAVKAIIDMAIKAIEANAEVAASGAAAATASIPIIGPALAVGAMAAMGGLVLGLIGSLPSAAIGGTVMSSGMAIVHAGEDIVPAQISQPYDGGGRGGGEIHVHIHAMDGASVQRVVEGPDFRRAVHRSIRNGSWARE